MMFKYRQRNILLITIAVVLTPCIVFLILMGPELSTQQTLSQRLAECQVRLQYLEALYRTRQEDVIVLTQYLTMQIQQQHQFVQNVNNNYSFRNLSNRVELSTTIAPLSDLEVKLKKPNQNSFLNNLSPETRKLMKNATTSQKRLSLDNRASFFSENSNLRMPSAYSFLPHLLDSPESLRPAYLVSKLRSDVSIVLGIPTVKRDKQSYVLRTLQNLVENMNDMEQNDTLIVVYIGETLIDNVITIAKDIVYTFETYVTNGLIDIVAPDVSYYPDFSKIRLTLNDSLERVKWRSKQNLDFAFLMSYAQSKGNYIHK